MGPCVVVWIIITLWSLIPNAITSFSPANVPPSARRADLWHRSHQSQRFPPRKKSATGTLSDSAVLAAATAAIEYQSDCGRGEQHLSASLQEGDVVVYQTGTWLVDGVQVGGYGDETTALPSFRYALIDTIQLVWTHNCEHGVLRGLELELKTTNGDDGKGSLFTLADPIEDVEFGPEQLIAKIPVEWDDTTETGSALVGNLPEWKPME